MPEKTTAAAWKKAKAHEVTLPSGSQVTMQVPNLPAMIRSGQIPNSLVNAAIETVTKGPGQEVSRELIEQQAEFYNHLVSVAVLSPKVQPDDVPELPFEDVELIIQIATREEEFDAVGHQIGGLHTNKDFRTFRGLLPLDEDLASL